MNERLPMDTHPGYEVEQHGKRVVLYRPDGSEVGSTGVWEGDESFMTVVDLQIMAANDAAQRRGWLTGDINQTDKWFQD